MAWPRGPSGAAIVNGLRRHQPGRVRRLLPRPGEFGRARGRRQGAGPSLGLRPVDGPESAIAGEGQRRESRAVELADDRDRPAPAEGQDLPPPLESGRQRQHAAGGVTHDPGPFSNQGHDVRQDDREGLQPRIFRHRLGPGGAGVGDPGVAADVGGRGRRPVPVLHQRSEREGAGEESEVRVDRRTGRDGDLGHRLAHVGEVEQQGRPARLAADQPGPADAEPFFQLAALADDPPEIAHARAGADLVEVYRITDGGAEVGLGFG